MFNHPYITDALMKAKQEELLLAAKRYRCCGKNYAGGPLIKKLKCSLLLRVAEAMINTGNALKKRYAVYDLEHLAAMGK